ncbi:MAG: PhoH family protein [Planctomycetota bacterium]|nr:PhoH family protein [Planctomycetota bacterium]
MIEVTIPLRSNDEAVLVLGPYDRHAKLLRQALAIEIFVRGSNLRMKGLEEKVELAQQRIEHLLGKFRKGRELQSTEIEQILLGPSSTETESAFAPKAADKSGADSAVHGRGRMARAHPMIHARVRAIEPRGQNQRRYFELMEKEPLTFGLGAAGTGKTFLAVAGALRALRRGEVRRLIITRPVVEAGEHLGFLPGDLQAKLDPYMRPIYDALSELLQFEDVTGLIEAGVIEIAPLAYMRGRTLSNAFVVLDEAQNASPMQMKMFLTRLGEGSRMVVTGDPTQNDLERGRPSGLMDAVTRLRGFEGIGVTEFTGKDIVRHPLVESIVHAYERQDGARDA